MNVSTSKQIREDVGDKDLINSLSVVELSRFLRDLGKSLKRPENGPALGEALVRLSEALKQHSGEDLEGVLASLSTCESLQEKRSERLSTYLGDLDLQLLGTSQVKELLQNGQLSKQDLVQVGSMRFGIPKRRLERQSRRAIWDSLSSALHSEESYQVIGNEAMLEGLRRAKG